MGAMTPPSRKSCYNFRVTEINRVLDGDTIDVTIDLGFDIGDAELSLNEQMITEGYAHAYDGGTKDMNLEALREIRRAHGTLI